MPKFYILGLVFAFAAWIRLDAQPDQVRFSHIGIDEGLSNNQVNCIFKDHDGLMWFGTMAGLNRYDGYNFKVFRNDPKDTFSIADNFISSIFEDHRGRLWVGTLGGINVFEPATEQFFRYPGPFLDSLGIRDYSISKIYKDREGSYWYLSSNSGMYEYRTDSGKTKHYGHRPENAATIGSNSVEDMGEDPDGNLWIIHSNGLLEKIDRAQGKVVFRDAFLATKFGSRYYDYKIFIDSEGDVWTYTTNDARGVYFFDKKANTFTNFSTSSGPVRLNSNIVSGVAQSGNGRIWVATDGGGVNIIDKKTFSVRYLENDPEEITGLSHNSITNVYQESPDAIWLGTFKKGVNYYHEGINKVRLIRYRPSGPAQPSCDDVNCFAEDARGNLWIGTNGCGLLYYDRAKNAFLRYANDPANPNSLSSNVIVSLCIDSQGALWIGTFYGGLDQFDGTMFRHYKNEPGNSHSLADNRVWEVYEDASNNLWVGTLGGGLDLIDRQSQTFSHYRAGDLNGINSDHIFSLREDQSGNLWIGTVNGIDVRLKDANRVVHYGHASGDSGSLSNNNVLVILPDSRGLVWVGTREGLNLFNADNQTFTNFTMKDGLPDNTILTMVEDPSGDLWLSTPKGISQLTVRPDGEDGKPSVRFKNFDDSDGLLGKVFNENAAFVTSRGELIFGGSSGFNIFLPEDLAANSPSLKVVFTDLQIFNKTVRPGEIWNKRVILTNSIGHTEEIVLKHRENVFSIEFSSLNYLYPKKSRFAYKLEGFHDDWLAVDNDSRRATFTNLDPGEYVLKVKTSLNDGVWSEETASLKITILPPFWRTTLAFVIYGLILAGIIFLARQYLLDRERMKIRLETEHLQAQRVHEMDLMKIKFFTNLSHEFRTPLTLILGPLETIIGKTRDNDKKRQLGVVVRNAKRLLTMVNQLLDFRKMEVGKFTYLPGYGDVTGVIREVADSFSDLAEKKNIRFSMRAGVENLPMFFDQDKLEKILFNLLYNAFKFTPEGGEVRLETELLTERDIPVLQVRVIDTGIGIPADMHEKVFERFFQNDVSGSLVNQGIGIGLSLVKEFIELHGGTISLESAPDRGSTFCVRLPVKRAKEKQEAPVPGEAKAPSARSIPGPAGSATVFKKPSVLIVEDNEDFRFYLKDNLKEFYQIIEAADGLEGWHQAVKHIPDLVVSDVVMPVMDGVSLCKKLKSDPRTAHLPVILLSGRNSEMQVQEGFEIGADDYVIKPLNFEILHSRIKNLITSRTSLRSIVLKQVPVNPSQVEIPSPEEALIARATEIVEQNIEKSEFSVEDLSRAMGMSRVVLYKKLLTITGKSPSKFIRIIRLKKAAQLLEKSDMTVSEIAYTMGFSNPKQFSKYFKAEFDVLPSLFAQEKRGRTTDLSD